MTEKKALRELQRGSSGCTTYLFNSVIDIENVVELQIEDMVFTIE